MSKEKVPPPSSGLVTESLVRRQPAPLGVVLRCLNATAHPKELALSSGTITVGASSNAQFVIESPTVSRSHLEVTVVPEGVRVRDLESRNGTFYLGQRVEVMTVQPGTRLLLGSTELAIEPDIKELEREPDGATRYGDLIGISPAARRLFATLSRLEGSLINVLVLGPSGVGKELIARALHQHSSIQRGPFVAKNCAAMTRELILSELFGHRRGAFTGAVENRDGAFVAADGGTLFLDELGELPPDVQPVLLRALEHGEITPVGSNETRTVRVRVVAATNRDMEEDIRAGRFREDLYYRLAVVSLRVPPLRERPEDIVPLAQHFAEGAGIVDLPPDILERFRTYSWPGNARELRNAVLAYAALGNLLDLRAPSSDLLEQAFGQYMSFDKPFQDQKEELSDAFTKAYLVRLLRHTGGNQSEAARISGIERSYFRKLLAKHDVR